VLQLSVHRDTLEAGRPLLFKLSWDLAAFLRILGVSVKDGLRN